MTVAAGVPSPVVVDLPIYEGDPVFAPFRILSDGEGVDFTGFTGRAQVRRRVGSPVLLELDVVFADPQTDDDKGRLTVTASEDDTQGLPALVGVWDLELTDPGGDVRTWVRGSVPITSDVTRVDGS